MIVAVTVEQRYGYTVSNRFTGRNFLAIFAFAGNVNFIAERTDLGLTNFLTLFVLLAGNIVAIFVITDKFAFGIPFFFERAEILN
jgi:hypothetical protein